MTRTPLERLETATINRRAEQADKFIGAASPIGGEKANKLRR